MLTAENQQFEEFLNRLKENGDFFDCRGKTAASFKKYFLPSSEEMFLMKEGKIKTAKSPKKIILFGLDLIDLSALTLLDQIMKYPKEDFFYFKRRKNSIVIGRAEENFPAPPGGDLIFQKNSKNNYNIFINTKKGGALIKKFNNFFTEDKNGESASAPPLPREKSAWTKELETLFLDHELLKDAVEWSRNNKIWSELAKICLGCGICSYVCPLCFCFEIEDEANLDNTRKRCRKWNSCVLPSFSCISGGYNFRPTLKERYYNWFYHKFVRSYSEHGAPQCVACERCKIYCPAKIDILDVLKRILNDYTLIKNQKK